MKNIRKNNKGFTLVELIIVVAIIAVLSAVAAPQYIKYVERSRQGADASTLEEIRHAVEVEAAINPPENDATVTISTAGAIGTGSGTAAYANLAQVTEVVGPSVQLKSKGAQKAIGSGGYVIHITAEGKVYWDGAVLDDDDTLSASAERVSLLQAGTAPTT